MRPKDGVSRPTSGALSRVAIAATSVAAIALAGVASAAGSTSPFGYAIGAQGFRSYFIFNAHRGREVQGTLRLVNLNATAKTILVKAVDVSTASNGGLQYGNGQARSDGRWLRLAASRVSLPSGGSADVRFTVRVPHLTWGGEHFLGIVAVDRRVLHERPVGHGSVRLRLIPRLAMTVEVRLPALLTTSLKLEGAKIAVAPSGASVALAVSNPGNALILSTTGRVTVYQGGTPLFTQGIALGAFVPHTAIAYRVPWRGTPVEGTYEVRGVLRPAGARAVRVDRTISFGQSAIRNFKQETGRQAIETSGTPLALIAALAAAFVLALGLGIAYARARRRLASTG
jgi:hypothetical protein